MCEGGILSGRNTRQMKILAIASQITRKPFLIAPQYGLLPQRTLALLRKQVCLFFFFLSGRSEHTKKQPMDWRDGSVGTALAASTLGSEFDSPITHIES